MFRGNELERLYRDVRCGGFHPFNASAVHEIVGKPPSGCWASSPAGDNHTRLRKAGNAVREGRPIMTTTQETKAGTTVVYELEGTLLEACSCGILCPCWIAREVYADLRQLQV
jgi:hypothetical protein